MKSDLKYFKNSKSLPVDKFYHNVLYDKKHGYYNPKNPFGVKGDFITAPTISYLFSEMIALWIISTWELYGKPKNINIIELGPGDGSMVKTLLKVSKKFPDFNAAKKIYLFESSNILRKLQKKNIKNENVKWIKNYNTINKGPVIFFGNEFLDAIPIKQFKRRNNLLFEKHYDIKNRNKIGEIYKKATMKDLKIINSFNTLKGLKFFEFPKTGFDELKKIIEKISDLRGCLLLIDYGYFKPCNQSTLQSVFKHKKNYLLKHLGKADITSHVNFTLLEEFFLKNNLKVKKAVFQKEFLKKLGIEHRAEIISRKMKFLEKTNLYLRLKRLLSPNLMGSLFKVILTHDYSKNHYLGFE